MSACFQETIFENLMRISSLKVLKLKLKTKKNFVTMYKNHKFNFTCQSENKCQFKNFMNVLKSNTLSSLSLENFDFSKDELIELLSFLKNKNLSSRKLKIIEFMNVNLDRLFSKDTVQNTEILSNINKLNGNKVHDLSMINHLHINLSNHNFSDTFTLDFLLNKIIKYDKTRGKEEESFSNKKNLNFSIFNLIDLNLSFCKLSDVSISPLINLLNEDKICSLNLCHNYALTELSLKNLLNAIKKNNFINP